EDGVGEVGELRGHLVHGGRAGHVAGREVQQPAVVRGGEPRGRVGDGRDDGGRGRRGGSAGRAGGAGFGQLPGPRFRGGRIGVHGLEELRPNCPRVGT